MAICNTTIIEASSNLLTSTKLVLFKKSDLKLYGYTTTILPQNLEEEFSTNISRFIIEKLCYVISRQENQTFYEYFYEEARDILPNGFDTAIFLDNRNIPIALTNFYSAQGKLINLIISIESESNNNLGIITVANNLGDIYGRGNIEETSLPQYFTTKQQESSRLRKLVYSTDIASLPGGSVVKCGKNTICDIEDKQISTITISSDTDLVNRYDIENKSFGYYKGELSVYSWNKQNYYEISSLVYDNLFENNTINTKSNDYEKENHIDEQYTILYGAGKYFICIDKLGRKYLFDTDTRTFIDSEQIGYNFFIDPLDITGELFKIPIVANYETYAKYYPGIVGTKLNIKEELDKFGSLEFTQKIGNWFIFRGSKRNNNFYILSGINSGIYMTEEEYKNMFVVNDTTIIVEYTDYYQVYNENGIIETALYNNKEESEEENQSDKAYKNQPVFNTFFNYFRRSYRSLDLNEIPKIVGACGGFIFYEGQDEDGIIKYL